MKLMSTNSVPRTDGPPCPAWSLHCHWWPSPFLLADDGGPVPAGDLDDGGRLAALRLAHLSQHALPHPHPRHRHNGRRRRRLREPRYATLESWYLHRQSTMRQFRAVQIRSEREQGGQKTGPNAHPIDGINPPKIWKRGGYIKEWRHLRDMH